MSQYHFGAGRGRIKPAIAKQIDRIARKHGADFVNPRVPGEGYRFWFSCTSRGAPFDVAVVNAVFAALERKGLLADNGRDFNPWAFSNAGSR